MKISSTKMVCFSPTGTTKSIIQAIERGLEPDTPRELVDITSKVSRTGSLQTSKDELLIVAVPVYGGRVPALLGEWLHGMELDNTPVVAVVVYGNRDYEDALLELKDIIRQQGGVPIAGAAFIGEHSFSGTDTPIAVARPDDSDLAKAESFGQSIREKLASMTALDPDEDITVPGNYPYKKAKPSLSVNFIDVSDRCSRCGLCAEVCPVDAIDADNDYRMDKKACILCCACIKYCPEKARTMKAGAVKDIAIWLRDNCMERKEPALFL